MTKFCEFTAVAVMFISTITFAAENPKANPMRPEQIQKLLPIGVILENIFALVASRCHMIMRAGILYS